MDRDVSKSCALAEEERAFSLDGATSTTRVRSEIDRREARESRFSLHRKSGVTPNCAQNAAMARRMDLARVVANGSKESVGDWIPDGEAENHDAAGSQDASEFAQRGVEICDVLEDAQADESIELSVCKREFE